MRLIDADWVLNALTVYGYSYDYVSVGRVTEVIVEAPTIDAEPVRRGRWIEDKDRGLHWHCSECAYVIGVMKMDANYCPNCGAHMENGVRETITLHHRGKYPMLL